MSVCVCGCLQEPEEGIQSPGTGVRGDGESPNVDSGNRTQVFCKSRKQS